MKIKKRWLAALLLLIPPMVRAQTLPTTPIYTYSAAGGYAANGNLTNYTDSATGTWAMQYDGLNRLQSAAASAGTYQGLTLGWDYDSFGNRLDQTPSGSSSAPVPATVSATYNANNQVQTSSIPGMGPGSYDAAGNLVFDGINRMAYDAENRVCAAYNTIAGTITQYIYDADGNRVAKVNATSLNGNALTCAVGAAGTVEATYLLGQSGEQVTELDGSGNWKHTNVYAGGQLLATYDQDGSQQLLHFNIGDALGTKRVQASAAGVAELTCLSLPYGDGLSCNGAGQDATEHHFTGKERDQESGNDYFGARYYASSMGRWMSPDWADKPEPVPYSDLENPQSLNMYQYVLNNPLSKADPNGHCDIDGEHHGGLWCFGHALGFTETAKEQHADADNIRNLIAQKHLVAANGLPITAAVLGNMSDKDVTSLARQGMGQQLDQMADIGQLIDAALGAGNATKHDTSGTGPSAKATDIKTNISADEFGKNLEASGYKKTPSRDGNAINYTNGDKTYSVYRGNNGSSAQLTIGNSNQPVAKIRFDR